jgi:hypothetical protein
MKKHLVKNNSWRKTVRRYIYLFTLSALFLVGCSEQSSVVAPVTNAKTNEPNWISLPNMNGENGMSVMSMPIFQASKEIDGKTGGKILINEKYLGGPLGEVKVKAELEFPKDAFVGSKNITMILDTQFGLATFSPHSYFDKEAIYNAEFIGLDLTGVDPKNVGFVYQAEDGSYEYIDYTKIEVDIKNGKLKVRDAKLPHFSRYGFVN